MKISKIERKVIPVDFKVGHLYISENSLVLCTGYEKGNTVFEGTALKSNYYVCYSEYWNCASFEYFKGEITITQ